MPKPKPKPKKKTLVDLPSSAVAVPGKEGLYATRDGSFFTTVRAWGEGKPRYLTGGMAILIAENCPNRIEHGGEVLNGGDLLESAFPEIAEEAEKRAVEEGKTVVDLPTDAVAVPGVEGLHVTPSAEFFATGNLPKGRAFAIEIGLIDGRNQVYFRHGGEVLNGTELFRAAFPEIWTERGSEIMSRLIAEHQARSMAAYLGRGA